MPKLTSSVPRYRRHRGSGQAIVTLNGRDVYFGPHGTKASRIEYDRLIGEWLAAGRTLAQPRAEITLIELGAAYVRWADGYYRKNGEPTPTVEQIRRAVKMLCKELGYGRTPAAEFGPLALQAVQARLAETNRSRSYVNATVAILKRMVKWGASQQLIDASVHHALTTVGGLKQGRSVARETAPIAPADYALVEATLPHLPEVLADMMRLLRLLGCRPGELRNIRPCDVDRSGEVWRYTPASHKTEHHGKKRTIFIGPKSQEILAPYLLRESAHAEDALERSQLPPRTA